MKCLNILFFFSFFLSIYHANAQYLNMEQMANITGMPGGSYNDIWGYIDDEGREYAIIGSSQAINVYDITDCANPTLELEYLDGNSTIWRDFKSYDHYVYGVCDQGSEGLEIINMDNYSFSQNTTDFLRAHNVFVDEPNARLYVVGSNTVYEGMIIYDLASSPGNPSLMKKVQLDTLLGVSDNLYIHDIYVKNNIAYASHGYSGYYIWDVSDVENITLIGNYDENIQTGYNHSSWVGDNGDYAYVAREVPRGLPMTVVTLNGNTNPLPSLTFKDPLEAPTYTNNRPHNPFVKDDKLFISYYEDGVVVYDLTNPAVPELYGYCDTYLGNNGSGYGGNGDWHGAWGVYPYFPSGCIVASDLENGLFTMIMKEEEVKQTSGDLKVLAGDLVQKDLLGDTYAVSINASNQIAINPYAGAGSVEETKVINADYHLGTNNSGIYFKGQSGIIVKLTVTTTGNINVIPTALPSSDYTEVEQGDFIIDEVGKGLILTDSSGGCWKLRVENNQLKAYKTPCW
jgi:choice-of-anchor B domain-containing protein